MDSLRNHKGAMGSLLFCATILIGASIGCFATDFAHNAAVKEEMQNAVDAAALAGAQDLWANPQAAESDAREVLQQNSADGKRMINGTNGIVTKINVVAPVPPLVPGRVEVIASMPIRNLFGPMIGRFFDTLTTRGVAGTVGKIHTVFSDQLFPLGVNPNLVPPAAIGEAPISSKKVGDTVRLYINSKQWKNAVWTSLRHHPASASYIDRGIESLLGLQPMKPGTITSVAIGDEVFLVNGVISEKSLARPDELQALLTPNRPLTLPLVDSEPPFSQTAHVIGFISIQPTNVITSEKGGMVESIVGTIVNTQLRGLSESEPNALTSIEPGPIQLIE